MMEEIMLPGTPVEEREQILRDSCDQILERSYTRKFDQAQLDSKRAEIANVLIQINELEEQIKQIRVEYKGRIKPLEERLGAIRDEIKAGGEWVKTDCYRFTDPETGYTAIYSPEGYKLEERKMTPEERQRTVFQITRKTGTED